MTRPPVPDIGGVSYSAGLNFAVTFQQQPATITLVICPNLPPPPASPPGADGFLNLSRSGERPDYESGGLGLEDTAARFFFSKYQQRPGVVTVLPMRACYAPLAASPYPKQVRLALEAPVLAEELEPGFSYSG
jgi:hypothetical protein